MKQTAKTVSPMSNEGRNAYVTEHITAAMLSLLKENFQEKDDILKEHIRQLFREWTGTLKEDPPLDELIRRMFSHFEAHRDFYALLQKRGLTWLLKDVILSVCGFHPEQEAVNAYASAFAAYSLYGWVESAGEMAELFAGHSKE